MNAPVTIIVATHDGRRSLRSTLWSIARQDYGPVQVLVADGSADPYTRMIVDQCQPRPYDPALGRPINGIPDLTWLNVSDGHGKAHGINAAAEHATGQVLLIVDDDDILEPGYVTAMTPAVQACDLAGPRLNISHGYHPDWVKTRRAPIQLDQLHEIGGIPVVVGAGMGITRVLFDELGGFDPALLAQEDMDLSLRAADRGTRPAFVPAAVVHYVYRDTLAGIWRQERVYGRWAVTLAAKHGLPRRPARGALSHARGVALTIPAARTMAGRGQLATHLGALAGHLEGVVREAWTDRTSACPECGKRGCVRDACVDSILARVW